MSDIIDVQMDDENNEIPGRPGMEELPSIQQGGQLSLDVFSADDAEAATALGIVLAGSVEDTFNRIVVAQNAATALGLESGYLLLKANSEVKNGDFSKYLDSRGISSQRASELMRTAKFYTSLPPEQRRQVFAIGKSKLQLLANADIEVVQDLMEEPGEDLSALSVRQLRQRLRDMTNFVPEQVKVLKADVQRLESENARLKKDDHRTYHFELQTHLVREECLAHQAECELALNSLRQLFEDCINDDNKIERDLRIEQVWVTIHVAAARAMDALAFLRGFGLEGMPEAIGMQHRMLDDEALRWLDDYEQLERKHLKAQADRQEKRDAEKPRGRGRPPIAKG